LQAAGFGTLCYNFRGQIDTTFADDTDLTPDLIVDDLGRLMVEINPPSPILVGLSIGGLFAAQAYLGGTQACGLVLINTLRKPGQRLDWINQAMVRLAKLGGGRLVMLANMPTIASPDLLAKMWDISFSDEPYEQPVESDGLLRLMIGSLQTDWDIAYEKLNLPVLILTGKYDRVFRIDADINELKARIPEAEEKIYHDAGHLIPLENPDKFTDDLLMFATRCGS
jgi:pimeloyl-ACP methyl ester carboxylesterase